VKGCSVFSALSIFLVRNSYGFLWHSFIVNTNHPPFVRMIQLRTSFRSGFPLTQLKPFKLMRSGLWFLWYGVTPGEIWRTSSRDINYIPRILLVFRIFHFLMFCKVMCKIFWQPLYFICSQHSSDYTSQTVTFRNSGHYICMFHVIVTDNGYYFPSHCLPLLIVLEIMFVVRRELNISISYLFYLVNLAFHGVNLLKPTGYVMNQHV